MQGSPPAEDIFEAEMQQRMQYQVLMQTATAFHLLGSGYQMMRMAQEMIEDDHYTKIPGRDDIPQEVRTLLEPLSKVIDRWVEIAPDASEFNFAHLSLLQAVSILSNIARDNFGSWLESDEADEEEERDDHGDGSDA